MSLHDDLACRSCDGDGRMKVEVIYNGDQSYEDVVDCDRCDGTGLRCSCPVHPVTFENYSMDCLAHAGCTCGPTLYQLATGVESGDAPAVPPRECCVHGEPIEYVVAGDDDLPF